jgi:uncharacterized protein YegP (UPF0339 family)
MATYILSKETGPTYQVRLQGDNGETLLSSKGYVTKSHCLSGIAAIRANATVATHYEPRVTGNGKLFFNLTASNGQVIATSERYTNSQAREKAMAAVRTGAKAAGVAEEA